MLKPTDIKPFRLTASHRGALETYMDRTLAQPELEAAEAQAHTELVTAAALALALVLGDDLPVLRKYDSTVTVTMLAGDFVPKASEQPPGEWVVSPRKKTVRACHVYGRNVRKLDETVHPPSGLKLEIPRSWEYQGYCPDARGMRGHQVVLGLSRLAHAGDLYDLPAKFAAWLTACKATDAALLQARHALRSLIHKARTLQELAEVWPEAMALADSFSVVRVSTADDVEILKRSGATFITP